MKPRTCVAPEGRFVYGVHRPRFRADNLRRHGDLAVLGELPDGRPVDNRANFPDGDVTEENADWIYEIANPLSFKGATYIARSWADEKAANPSAIRLPDPPPVSLSQAFKGIPAAGQTDGDRLNSVFEFLPGPLKIALATSSTDPEDLVRLAGECAEFVYDRSGEPAGMIYDQVSPGRFKVRIREEPLFEAVANNPHLPAAYKNVMVLRPGAQGSSEIVGEFGDPGGETHVFEYLRRNSYIPWGHYAANMADNAVRYRIADLSAADVAGMRHLYYQRTYARLAGLLAIELPAERRPFTPGEMEGLRCRIVERIAAGDRSARLDFNAALWGWNFGFDFSPSGYRLNASHQQVHQQFAMVPDAVATGGGDLPSAADRLPAFSAGDLVSEFCREYRRQTGRAFFEAYLEAIRTNRRMDGRSDREAGLAIRQDEETLLFVPKAQTSQWEIQLMCRRPVGNVLEADAPTRRALDRGIHAAVRLLYAMGARMVTAFEYAKRFDSPETDQRLLYVFLPRIPQSPGGFSEHQLRWITGHYPEDFAAACRGALPEV